MGTETVRAAVVGVGHLGRFHARLLAGIEGVELAALVDPRPDIARPLADELGVPLLASPDELPDDVRAVSVAVPTSLHHAVTCPLLERGMHVLVEKPMAATLQEAQAMAALAADRGLVLHVGHIERFNPVLSVLRELDVRPQFIEAHRLAPFNFRTLDVSVVMDLMIHDLDIVLELAGAPLERVEAVGSKVLAKHVDIANARLTFENGCVANVTASRVSFTPLRRTRVFAEDAFVSMDFAVRRAFVARLRAGFDPASLDAAAQQALQEAESFKAWVQQGLMDLREIDMDASNPLLSELQAFVAAVRGDAGAEPGVPAGAGLRAMRTACEIQDLIESRVRRA